MVRCWGSCAGTCDGDLFSLTERDRFGLAGAYAERLAPLRHEPGHAVGERIAPFRGRTELTRQLIDAGPQRTQLLATHGAHDALRRLPGDDGRGKRWRRRGRRDLGEYWDGLHVLIVRANRRAGY